MLVLNLAVAAAKIAFGYTSGAISILSDGFHSLTDAASNVVGLVGVRAAHRPPDADHPYGHRKYETVAAAAVTVFLLLVLSLRAVGVSGSEVDVIEIFAAWSLVRIIGAIPITPGGFGIVELGLTTALVAFGGNNAGVVAGVLIYRFLTVVPTIVLGGLSALTLRSHRRAPEST